VNRRTKEFHVARTFQRASSEAYSVWRLAYRIAETGSLELLLITTRQTKQWIIPKGWPVKGLKPAKSAAREAYEEAGIRGAISAKPIGAFSYDKRLEENGFTVPCEVRVFAMSVRRQLKSWPEAYERDSGGSNYQCPLRAQRRGPPRPDRGIRGEDDWASLPIGHAR